MKDKMDSIQYTILIPVYNSEKTLETLVDRIFKTMNTITSSFELLLVDDCSRDNSWNVLKTIRTRDNRIKIIHLSTNSGQHNAYLCGLNYSSGEHIIILDDDLQNPPEEIPKLINKIDEGYSVVYGRYIDKKHGTTKNTLGIIYHYVTHFILNIPESISLSNYIIMSSDVRNNILNIKCSFSFINGLIAKVTPPEKVANVDVIHEGRTIGRSNYTFFKHMKLLINLIINYSSIPLVCIGMLGIITSIFSITYAIFLIINKIINPASSVEGWLSLMVAVSFLGGMILLSIAVVGEYTRRILTEITYSQPFIIGEMDL